MGKKRPTKDRSIAWRQLIDHRAFYDFRLYKCPYVLFVCRPLLKSAFVNGSVGFAVLVIQAGVMIPHTLNLTTTRHHTDPCMASLGIRKRDARARSAVTVVHDVHRERCLMNGSKALACHLHIARRMPGPRNLKVKRRPTVKYECQQWSCLSPC